MVSAGKGRRKLNFAVRRPTESNAMSRIPTEGSGKVDAGPLPGLLLVENDPDDAYVVEGMLRRNDDGGYQVATVFTVQEGLDALGGQVFDAVVYDLGLGDDESIQAVAAIQQRARHAPIIVLSSRSDAEMEKKVIEAGAHDFLWKGHLSRRELVRTLRYAVDRKKKEAELDRMAHQDPLTGLANRVRLEMRLEAALSEGDPSECIGLLFLDLDGFKPINDNFGHEVGDRILCQVAQRLRESVRDTETVARFGGDEFVILLRGLRVPDDASIVARRILRRIADPLEDGDVTHKVGVSIGGAVGLAGDRAEDLLERADTAMYRVKRSGRNAFALFDPFLDGTGEAAFDSRGVCYRPSESLIVGGPVRWEVFVRAQSSTQDLLRAQDHVKSDRDAVRSLIQNIIEDLALWEGRGGAPWRVTVRAPVLPSADAGFAEVVRVALEEFGVDGRRIELVVDEPTLEKDPANSRSLMESLHALGMRFVLRSFGTASGPINCLIEYPLDAVEIDSSFIPGVHTNDRRRRLVSSLTHLALDMGLEVRATGITTGPEIETLRGLGFAAVWGGPMAPPRTMKELTSMARCA